MEKLINDLNEVTSQLSYYEYTCLYNLINGKASNDELLSCGMIEDSILSYDLYDLINNAITDFVASNHLETWDDEDSDFPNNNYHMGFIYNDDYYIHYYSGISGNYWGSVITTK